MVYGIGQTDETNHVEYDYIGVMYPEGNMGEGSQFLFNHSDIQTVVFRGFEDEERDKFKETLEGLYDAAR